MKTRLLAICVFMLNTFGAYGQIRGEAYMPAFSIDVDVNAGILNQQAKSIAVPRNYSDLVNPAIGKLTFNSEKATSMDIQLDYFVGRQRKIGFGMGCIYYSQASKIGLDYFHVEFRSRDFLGNVFRQVITSSDPIAESINMHSLKIPLLLKYKKDFTVRNMLVFNKLDLFFNADAGIVFNVQLQNTWNTNANFNYEAIYHFTGSGDNPGTTYDNNPIPDSKDLIISQSQFLKSNPKGDVNTYFSTKNAAGFSVGLNEKVKKSSGKFKLPQRTIGYTVNAAMNFKLSKKIFLKVGGYYLAEKFNNAHLNNSGQLTSKIIRNSSGQDVGVDYQSLMNFIGILKSENYGVTIGLKFFISSHSLLDYQ